MSGLEHRHDELILNYLERMDWKPVSVEVDNDELWKIVVLVEHEEKNIRIVISFKNDGIWLSISSRVLQNIDLENTKLVNKILSINFETTLTKFGMTDGKLYAMIELPLYSLEFEEFQAAMRRIVNDVIKYIPQLTNGKHNVE